MAHIHVTAESGYFKYNKLVVLDAENTTLASEMRMRQDEQGHHELQLVILEVCSPRSHTTSMTLVEVYISSSEPGAS